MMRDLPAGTAICDRAGVPTVGVACASCILAGVIKATAMACWFRRRYGDRHDDGSCRDPRRPERCGQCHVADAGQTRSTSATHSTPRSPTRLPSPTSTSTASQAESRGLASPATAQQLISEHRSVPPCSPAAGPGSCPCWTRKTWRTRSSSRSLACARADRPCRGSVRVGCGSAWGSAPATHRVFDDAGSVQTQGLVT